MENDLLIITLTMHFLFDSFLISKVLNKKFGEVYKVFLFVALHVSILCLHFLHFPSSFFYSSQKTRRFLKFNSITWYSSIV